MRHLSFEGHRTRLNTRLAFARTRALTMCVEALETRQLLSATIATDQLDYAFGSTALISGDGFAAGETVRLQVTHAPGSDGSNDDPQNQAWLVTDGGEGDLDGVVNGSIRAAWAVDDPDARGATYYLDAVGLTSGETARTLFTDASDLSFSGTVYNDINGNGRFDTGETGIAGASITVYTSSAHTTVASGGAAIVTGANGAFTFGSLPKGTTLYAVITPPAGYSSTGATAGSSAVMVSASEVRVSSGSSGGTSTGTQFMVKQDSQAPTNISLSSSAIAENLAAGATVGAFSTTDGDSSSFTYSLVTGTGSTDNASFTIVGNELHAVGSFNFEAKSSYSIRVRTTDSTSLTFEKVFTITIADVTDASSLVVGSAGGTYGGTAALSATLSGAGPSLSGKTIVFILNGISVGSAVTNSSGVATLSSASLAGVLAGSFASGVSASFAGDSGYFASSGSAALSVAKASLTVAADAQSKTYGQANPSLTGSLSGIKNGDNITVSYGTTALQFSDVGAYPITATLNDPTGKLSNYTVTNAGATLTIGKADQALTWAAPAGIVYGTALSATQLNATVAGVSGGSAAGALSYNYSLGTILSAGNNQSLTVNAAATQNYNAATATVHIDVAKATLHVKANGKTKDYGEPVPDLDGTISGLVAGDTISAGFATTADTVSAVGVYPITPTAYTDPAGKLANYAVVEDPAMLVVQPTDTSVKLTAPAGPARASGTVTLRAHVNPLTGVAVPVGQVKFYEGATLLGAASVVDGDAVLPLPLDAGDHVITAVYTNSDGNMNSSSTPSGITQAVWANPKVKAFKLNNGAAQRSDINQISFDVDHPVSLASGDLQLVVIQGSSSNPVGRTYTPSVVSNGATAFTLTFATPLPDGVYQLTVLGSAKDSLGQGISALGNGLKFHRLLGDLNGDKTVSSTELNTVMKAYTASTLLTDFNGTGIVTKADVLLTQANYAKKFVY